MPPQSSSWLDEKTQTPTLDEAARRLESFTAAMADGHIDDSELKSQKARLVKLLKEVEPQLDPALHQKVTELLCELTAYNLMGALHTMQQARPKTVFRG